MNRPIAVLISDIHYNINTLEVADAALRMAVDKANELDVNLIIAGDLHDTKANLRGECVNAMLKTINAANLKPYIIVGNHDKINEKSEEHSLNFLSAEATIINNHAVEYLENRYITLIAYQHDKEQLVKLLSTTPKNRIVIMHQGIEGSDSGDYIQDKSAITKDDVKDFRVISGHYHNRQDIKTGRPQKDAVGLFSYIGNPYTLGFGEANHKPKGFQILMDDGTLEFVPTNLRKHVVIDCKFDADLGLFLPAANINPKDLVWVKVTGTKEQLGTSVTRKDFFAHNYNITQPFKLDLIPLETVTQAPKQTASKIEVLDGLIDSLSNTTDDRKKRLKDMWRTLCE